MPKETSVNFNSSAEQVDYKAVQEAATLLRQGGVLAYPTEAVWGLGCDPFNSRALQRLLLLKQRDPTKGVILIAATIDQFKPWLTDITPVQRKTLEESWPGPQTWLVKDNGYTPELIRGKHTKVALRVSDHPCVVALCEAFDGPLVSTSANTAGQPPLLSYEEIEQNFSGDVDMILKGALGGLDRPTRITDLETGKVLRA